jgi:cyclohexanecarboxyl-CoA dehydrogenase
VVAICLTEPRGGSDASNLQLKARRVHDASGDHYVLNGEKTSITFADRADAYLIFARTGAPDEGAKGVSAFFIPYEGTKGISRTHFDDVGSAVIGRGSVFLDDVRVPVSHRLGDEGKGFTQVMQGFDYSRALIGLQCCGAAQASLDEAWAYAKEREAFGRPIGQFQGVSFRWPSGTRTSPRCASSATTRWRCATPACRTPRKPRCASGWGRRPRSTPSTNAC